VRKYSIIFLFLSSSCLRSFAQDPLSDIASTYLRSNPFDKEFSKFLGHLLNDPTIINKTMMKRTDTSLFYFKGEYTQHNPFTFKAKRVEVILAETEIQLNDSIPRNDTIILYQLLGYTNGGKEGLEDAKKDFNRFNRKFGNEFTNMESRELTKKDQVVGTINNYFLLFYLLSPVTVAWASFSDAGENVFAITLRIKVKENIAILL